MTTVLERRRSRTLSEPLTVADLGLDRGVLLDQTMKTLFYRGRMTRTELAHELKLSASVLQEVMQALTQDALASVLGSEGGSAAGYVYALTQKGLDRAEAAFARSGYVGPAPVPLAQYIAQVHEQTIGDAEIVRAAVERALSPLVLNEHTTSRVGRAVASRRSMLVYGAPGNGKTTIVRSMGAVLEGSIYLPYAIEMVGQIVHLYDPSKHELLEDEDEETEDTLLRSRRDHRWVRIRRPVVWAGGELTRHSLELMYDDNSKVYEAPLQLKANGGTLIIDDFGRQQIPAEQLLNRWIVALEGGVDHLTLHTGQTIEIPFDVMVLFSTNLPPERLADEAFLRRIRYKVEVPDPTEHEYREIFAAECDKQGVPYDDAAVSRLLHDWYDDHGRAPRGCHPRDLVEAIVDVARYDGRTPLLTAAALDEVCATYFLRPAGSHA
jgi:predicted ATPase with chaperone activity